MGWFEQYETNKINIDEESTNIKYLWINILINCDIITEKSNISQFFLFWLFRSYKYIVYM